MTIELFDIDGEVELLQEVLASGAVVLRGFAILHGAVLLANFRMSSW